MCPLEKPVQAGNFLRLPKVGETADYSENGPITEIKRVNGGKFCYIKREKNDDGSTVENNLGYHDEVVFENGKVLTIASWGPYYALANGDIIEGDLLRIIHKAKSEWSAEKVLPSSSAPVAGY